MTVIKLNEVTDEEIKLHKEQRTDIKLIREFEDYRRSYYLFTSSISSKEIESIQLRDYKDFLISRNITIIEINERNN